MRFRKASPRPWKRTEAAAVNVGVLPFTVANLVSQGDFTGVAPAVTGGTSTKGGGSENGSGSENGGGTTKAGASTKGADTNRGGHTADHNDGTKKDTDKGGK